LFGASKVTADVMVQEHGRYLGMSAVCYRGGCLTRPNNSGAQLHSFLPYLTRYVREKPPCRIYGYKRKQVHDNVHSWALTRSLEDILRELATPPTG
jgi:CDP-paratose 2-epimerase